MITGDLHVQCTCCGKTSTSQAADDSYFSIDDLRSIVNIKEGFAYLVIQGSMKDYCSDCYRANFQQTVSSA